MSHLCPGIVDFACSTRLDREKLSQSDTRLIGTLHAKSSGKGKAVELCEGDEKGDTHEELPHQTACMKSNFTFGEILEAIVISGL